MNLNNTPRQVKRNEVMQELRAQGYTYDAIAEELFRLGLTDTRVSKTRIRELMVATAPHLTGNVKKPLGLPRLIRARDLRKE